MLPRFHKRLISIAVDMLGLWLVAVMAIWLRFGDSVFPLLDYLPAIALLSILALPIFITRGLYRAVVRYIGHHFAMTVLTSVTMVFVLWAAAIFMLDLKFPRSAIVIAWLLALFYIGITRLAARWLLSEGLAKSHYASRKKCGDFWCGFVRETVAQCAGKGIRL